MASSQPPSGSPSRSSTPNPPSVSRFTSQNATAEDLLKSQTVGLVHLSEFRKRRADALEQKEREAQDRSLGRFTPAGGSGAATPSDRALTPQPPKKKRKPVAKGKLSFGLDDEEEPESTDGKPSANGTPRSSTPAEETSGTASDSGEAPKRRLGPNASVAFIPKAKTKSALLKEAQAREQLRKEFLAMQEAVKAEEIMIPFVFYDGTNIPGGMCKVTKGSHIWLFLDKARKVGAELGVGGSSEKQSRREWARVSVDDLMLVRGELIIPHHYEFYYFIVNKIKGPGGMPLFDYSAQPRQPVSNEAPDPSNYNPLSNPSKAKKVERTTTAQDQNLEGAQDNPAITKVVDRRWYEKNKHIFPASVWEEFDPTKDYSTTVKRDSGGNAFFFS